MIGLSQNIPLILPEMGSVVNELQGGLKVLLVLKRWILSEGVTQVVEEARIMSGRRKINLLTSFIRKVSYPDPVSS